MQYIESQRHFLFIMKKLSPQDFQIYLTGEPDEQGKRRWVKFEQWDWRNTVSYHSVLPNEILFDYDHTNWSDCRHAVTSNFRRFRSNGVPQNIFLSGGKGIHASTILLNKRLKSKDWDNVREIFCDTVQVFNDVDTTRLKWSSDRKGVLVRAIGARKVGYKTWWPEIPAERTHSEEVFFPPEMAVHYIRNAPERGKIEMQGVKQGFVANLLSNSNTGKMCVDLLYDEMMAGIHIGHYERIILVGHLWKRECMPLLKKEGYNKAKEEFVEKMHKLFAHDPNYNIEVTDYQLNYLIAKMEEKPWLPAGCKYIQQNCALTDGMCTLCEMW